jgi:NADH:ubiquinone oxidoreductase subunit 2 (subunit N)
MAYYLRVIIIMLKSGPEEGIKAKEAPLLMVGVTLVMCILIIVLGIYPNQLISMASDASQALVEGLDNYIGVVL